MTGLISVILTTYQREDALEVVLRALSRQTDRAFEVIVADDGSRPPTHAVVDRRAAQADTPIRHVWQEDRGFRLAEIAGLLTRRAGEQTGRWRHERSSVGYRWSNI